MCVENEKMQDGGENVMGKYYVVRGEASGVFAGTVTERNGKEVRMQNVRKLWYWAGACAVEQLAVDGVTRPRECKFTVSVPEIVVTDAIQIIPATEKAERSIKGVAEWKE